MLSKKSSWIFYDVGNSAFATTVVAGFFPVFFKKYWSAGVEPEITTSRLGFALGAAGFLMALLAPVWGRKSDLASSRKLWLLGFASIGILFTGSLYFVPLGHWTLAIAFYVLAYVGFEASLIFYDSLLPEVVEPADYNSVSSQGFAYGYLGGGLLFVLNVVMTLLPQKFGFEDAAGAVKFSFLTVALWWGAGTWILYRGVDEARRATSSSGESWQNTFRQLKNSFLKIFEEKNIFYFLLAYWFYIDGVYTVFTMAVDYGLSLGLAQEDLMKALLVTQFVGFPSALLFGKLSDKFSVKHLLTFCLVVYSGVLIYSTRLQNGFDFMVLAGFVGLVQGGVQALSRSYFAHLVPQEQAAEYFGFFNVVGKSASIIGPILVAVTALITRDSRHSLLSVILLFILGVFFLNRSRPSEQMKTPAQLP